MGKYQRYNPQKDYIDTYRNSILCSIANELAESNRLKRLELTIIRKSSTVHSKHRDEVWHTPSDKELEDQA